MQDEYRKSYHLRIASLAGEVVANAFDYIANHGEEMKIFAAAGAEVLQKFAAYSGKENLKNENPNEKANTAPGIAYEALQPLLVLLTEKQFANQLRTLHTPLGLSEKDDVTINLNEAVGVIAEFLKEIGTDVPRQLQYLQPAKKESNDMGLRR